MTTGASFGLWGLLELALSDLFSASSDTSEQSKEDQRYGPISLYKVGEMTTRGKLTNSINCRLQAINGNIPAFLLYA